MSRTAVSERATKPAAKSKTSTAKPTGRAAPKKSAKAASPSKRAKPAADADETAPPPKFAIELDERTAGLTAEALACRETNHHWVAVSQGHAMRALMAHRGQFETVRTCQTCGSSKSDLYWLPSFEKVRQTRYTWSAGYLVDKEFAGRGRLSKADVLKETFVRENLDLVA